MLLYHGSNQLIENPIIINSKRTVDFGTSFYLTTSFIIETSSLVASPGSSAPEEIMVNRLHI